jgi:4-hydroxy-tetrahydrodipicolinate synthase
LTSNEISGVRRARPAGPWAASLTPIKDREIDAAKLVKHVEWLLDNGCHGVVLFGSTGEAASFTVDERMRALDYVRQNGVPRDKIIVGTGCCATIDSARLSSHAIEHGCAGVIVIPPYFYKPLEPRGLHKYYATLIESVASDNMHLYLYHFPELSGVPITNELIRSLAAEFPNQVAGVKDSSGDLENTLRLVKDFPDLDIFTGDDDLLWPLVKAGGAGSITATDNIIPHVLASIWQAATDGAKDPPAEHQIAGDVWSLILNNYPIVESLKECLAQEFDDAEWRVVREPLNELCEFRRDDLQEQLANTGFSLHH